jgi:putative protease
MTEQLEEVGQVTGYFAKPSVAIVQMTKGLVQIGDTISIKGHTTDLQQTIASMQVDHAPIREAAAGTTIGLQTTGRVRVGDHVYRIISG